MKKRVLISVSDKKNLAGFAKELKEKYGFEIVATGSTAEFLKENNIESVPVSQITNATEMLGGKVKTLHPNIFAGILVDLQNKDELKEISDKNINAFQMVVVNLYPFEKAVEENADEETLIKNIDIGGVALLRAGAKNYKNVAVLSSLEQYESVLANLEENDGETSLELRKELSEKAFKTTSGYDSMILKELSLNQNYETVQLEKIQDLRYGENPHQKAALYKSGKTMDFEILNGKELSYNNILDVNAAVGIVSEFYDVPCVAVVKHTTPCGAALGKTIQEAYEKAFDCDPISAFGGIIAFTQTVTTAIAKHASDVFLEVLIAPDFEDEALEILKKKKNLRIIKLNTPLRHYKSILSKEIKVTPFGTLVQEADKKELDKETFSVVTKKKPDADMVENLVFAWKIAKHVKSNAIVVAKDFKTLAICGGQTSRIDAMEMALDKACDEAKDAVVASDGFFPAIDNIQAAAQNRIAAIIQPGGSIKDNEVIESADNYNMIMITTGIRHFKH